MQLETSHHDELNELTASFLAETAIKVETARLETEHDWQQKLDEMKEKHALEVDAITEKMTQVSDEFTLKIFPRHYFFSLDWVSQFRCILACTHGVAMLKSRPIQSSYDFHTFFFYI